MILVDARFNPDMLRLARDSREITQGDLARMSGVTQALISKIENGLTQPSDEVVEKIAATLRYPRSFFFQHERAIGFPPFHYRKRARLGAKQLGRIGALINIRRQHIVKLMRSYEREVLKPIPQIDIEGSGQSPEKIAERLRQYWMLPRGPVANVVEVVEQAGAIVVPTKFDSDLLDGLSFRSEGLPSLIFLNKDMPGDRCRFSLAHELAHLVMHTVPADDQQMEAEAHRFAAAFLMPAADVRPYLSDVKISSLGRVKAFWKVSIKALLKRAHELKLITDPQYRRLSITYAKSFKEGEPFKIPQEVPTRLQEIVQHHTRALGYSTEDLAALLCLTAEDSTVLYGDGATRLRVVVSN